MIIKTLRQKDPFARVARKMLEDPRLTWKAKGILSYLIGQSDNWEIRVGDLMNKSANGRDAIYSALNELRSIGYAKLKTIRKNGKFHSKQWIVRDFSPLTEKPFTGNPFTENPDINKNKGNKKKKTHELRSGPNGLVLNGEDQSRQLVQRYVEFSIKNRIHVGKPGSTINGWQKSIVLDWEKRTRELLQQVDVLHVKKVLEWYFDHWKDQYTPSCKTMKKFCERFSDLEDAIRRSRNGHGGIEDDSPAPRITYE